MTSALPNALPRPYLILALPRSRTFWLANFLSAEAPAPCGHDVLVNCRTTDDFINTMFISARGSVETAGVLGVRLWQARIPNLRIVLIRRPLADVIASLEKFSVDFDHDDLWRKNAMLDELSLQPGVESIDYADLSNNDCTDWLWEYCNETAVPAGLSTVMQGQNLQIDMAVRLTLLQDEAPRITGLKLDLAERLGELDGKSRLIVREESFYTCWQECDALGKLHWDETHADWEASRPYNVDWNELEAQFRSGALHIVSARVAGKLVGYMFWHIFPDPESRGLWLANMGPWFALAGNAKAAHKLYIHSLDMLRGYGIDNAILHHRTLGRGANLDKFYLRHGAKLIQQNFLLPLTDEPPNG